MLRGYFYNTNVGVSKNTILTIDAFINCVTIFLLLLVPQSDMITIKIFIFKCIALIYTQLLVDLILNVQT